ncbi:MAG: hypothetical protein BWY92_01827 [Firmicutes bacterium ADurb.BinA052]|nr:MAG: hypothetical protein BWY92_01827 [Firmicutes bacterium ADurb.BinA052]
MRSAMICLMPSWNLSSGFAFAVSMTCWLRAAFSRICSKKMRSSSEKLVPKRSLSAWMISDSGALTSLDVPVPTSVGLFTPSGSPSLIPMSSEKIFWMR